MKRKPSTNPSRSRPSTPRAFRDTAQPMVRRLMPIRRTRLSLTTGTSVTTMVTTTVVVMVVVMVVITGCGQTYIDDRATATTAAAVTTTTSTLPPVPANANANDLVDQLADAMAGLSEAIVEQDNPTTKLDRVNEIWAVLQEKLPENSVERDNLQTAIDLANTGVTAKHPADADKGYRIVNTIISNR